MMVGGLDKKYLPVRLSIPLNTTQTDMSSPMMLKKTKTDHRFSFSKFETKRPTAVFSILLWIGSFCVVANVYSQDRLAPPDRSKPSTDAQPPKSEKQLAEDRKARDAARKRGEITFDDLKFDIEKGGEFKKEMITKEIEELNKKTVKLRGFILPTSVFQQSGIKQFVLVRDNQECCFGPGAALYDCVIIEMQAGKTATFSTRVVSVKGKLEIDSESFQYPDGGHYAIYKMTAEEVK
jgi:hypothetical protein